jgi:putative ABC transport system permease protein
MAIPFSYNFRNLRLRLATTIMTALGIALTVAVAVFILSLITGLNRAFVQSGDPLNVLAIRKGSQTEMQSGVDRASFGTIKFLPGIAKSKAGEPMVSGEFVVIVTLPRRNGTGDANITVRGMSQVGLELRPNVHLVEGRWFNPGQREIVVSQSIDKRFSNAGLGQELFFGKGKWKIVGMFDAGETSAGSEIWADADVMGEDFNRTAAFSSVLVHAVDPAAAEGLRKSMSEDQRLKLDGLSEPAYYAAQTSSGRGIQVIGFVITFVMAVGSCFAAMNTMYAAVAYRGREIATLRILGFSRPSIITSFVIESVLLSLLGAALGLLLTLPLNGMTTSMGNLAFSETVFSVRLTGTVALIAVLFAIVMGLFGGIAPAWHAARREILAALRD